MSNDIVIDPVGHVTVGATGEPGQRTFFLQASGTEGTFSFIVEKQHVISIAEGASQLLAEVGIAEPSASWDAETMSIDESLEPVWRVGEMGLGFDEDRDLVLLRCTELSEPGVDPATADIWMTRAQLGALASYGMVVVSQGRKSCPFCTLPMDPEGHECPAVNGHKEGFFG